MQKLLLSAVLLASALPAQAEDLTLTRTTRTEGDSGRVRVNTQTMLIRGERSRILFQSMVGDSNGHNTYGPHIAMIQQCDLRQTLTVELDNRLYSITPLPAWPAQEKWSATLLEARLHPREPPKETLTVTQTIVDTHEQRQAFGRILRHYQVHREEQPSPGANAQGRVEDSDGWYVEIPEYRQLHACNPFDGHEGKGTRTVGIFTSSSTGPPNYRIVFQPVGRSQPAAPGYPADMTRTTKSFLKMPSGPTKEFTTREEERIDELSTASLDPWLFDIPRGFTRIDHVQTNPGAQSLAYRAQIAWARFKQNFSR